LVVERAIDMDTTLVEFKEDNSPVTIADILAQIMTSLKLNELFPGEELIGEESPDVEKLKGLISGKALLEPYLSYIEAYEKLMIQRSDQKDLPERIWIVDPIDGTREFPKGTKFAYSLGRYIWDAAEELYIHSYSIVYSPKNSTRYRDVGLEGPLVEYNAQKGHINIFEKDGNFGKMIEVANIQIEEQTRQSRKIPVLMRDSESKGPNPYRKKFIEKLGTDSVIGQWNPVAVAGLLEVLFSNFAVFFSPGMSIWDGAAVWPMIAALDGITFQTDNGKILKGYTKEDIKGARNKAKFSIIATVGGIHASDTQEILGERDSAMKVVEASKKISEAQGRSRKYDQAMLLEKKQIENANTEFFIQMFTDIIVAGKSAGLMNAALQFSSSQEEIIASDIQRGVGLDKRIGVEGLEAKKLDPQLRKRLETYLEISKQKGLYLANLIELVLRLDDEYADRQHSNNALGFGLDEVKAGLDGIKPRIAVLGATGHVGLPTSVMYAIFGFDVRALDINREALAGLNAEVWKVPFFDEAIEKALQRQDVRNRINFLESNEENFFDTVKNSDVFILTLPTPDKDGQADTSYIEREAARIVEATIQQARLSNETDVFKLITVKSTVPAGTGKRIEEAIKKKIADAKTQYSELNGKNITIELASNPEFLREQFALKDSLEPDRTVIGVESLRAARMLYKIYRPLKSSEAEFDKQLVLTNRMTAEMIKYLSNSWLGFKIGVGAAASQIFEEYGGDYDRFRESIGSDERIRKLYLMSSLGCDGPCLPKDLHAVSSEAARRGRHAAADFFRTILESNFNQRRHQTQRIIDEVGENGDLTGKTIVILGAAFAHNTDDVKFSATIEAMYDLLAKGATLRVYDPAVRRKELHRELKRVAGLRGHPNPESYISDVRDRIQYSRDKRSLIKIEEFAEGADAIVIWTGWQQFARLRLDRLAPVMKNPVLFNLTWAPDVYKAPFVKNISDTGFIYHTIGVPKQGQELKYFTDDYLQVFARDAPLKEQLRDAAMGVEQKKTILLVDSAMAGVVRDVGGIDLNPTYLDLQIKRDPNGVPLPVSKQSIADIHIEGILPVIINIAPLTVPMLLSMTGQDYNDAPASARADQSHYPQTAFLSRERLEAKAR